MSVRLKMNNSSTGNNTMNKTTAPKRVTKKTETPVAAAPAPVAATPAPAETKVKRAKPVAAAPVEEVPAAAPVTEAAAPADVMTVEQEIAGLIASHQRMRDESTAAIKSLQRLQKRVAREMKEAGRRRRRARREEGGEAKEKRPTIFTTPVTLRDELCAFLGKSKGTQMTPADVTRAFSAYVEQHKLKDAEKGHTIHPDAAMRKVLGVKDTETLTYRNIQRYLYKLYVLPERKPATA